MATGTSVSNTAYGIIGDAMVDVGFLQEGQRPDSEQIANYMRRLNDIINLWQSYGLKLFLQQEYTFPLATGQLGYTFGPESWMDCIVPKPSRILHAFMTNNTSGVRRPLSVLSVDEWERLGQTMNAIGSVNSYMVRKYVSYLHLFLWPAPDAQQASDYAATVLLQVQPSNPVILSDSMFFPQEWRIALRWALAEDICTGQPQAIIDRCTKNAELYRQQLEGWDVEDAPTYFGVDMRVFQGYGRFK